MDSRVCTKKGLKISWWKYEFSLALIINDDTSNYEQDPEYETPLEPAAKK